MIDSSLSTSPSPHDVRRRHRHRRERRMSNPTSPYARKLFTVIGTFLTFLFASLIASWCYVLWIAPWPIIPKESSANDAKSGGVLPTALSKDRLRRMEQLASNDGSVPLAKWESLPFVTRQRVFFDVDDHPEGRGPRQRGQRISRTGYRLLQQVGQLWRPRVVGFYSIAIPPQATSSQSSLVFNKGNRNRTHVPFMYLTERIDPYLLSHTSQILRRVRVHPQQPTQHRQQVNMRRKHISTSSYVGRETPFLSSNTNAIYDSYNHTHHVAGINTDVLPPMHDPLSQIPLSKRNSFHTYLQILHGSEDYLESLADPLNDDSCEIVPKHEHWITSSFPTCNLLHEGDLYHSTVYSTSYILNNGYWRDVWHVRDFGSINDPSAASKSSSSISHLLSLVLKTMRYEHDYSERNYDRHRRDALASERLSSSPRIVHIYGYCGNSGYYEYTSLGSLEDALEEHYTGIMSRKDRANSGGARHDGSSPDYDDDAKVLTRYDKLNIAHQVAAALADAHDIEGMKDENGNIISSAIVHADIEPKQFLFMENHNNKDKNNNAGGMFKLNDFNRCRFMRRKINSTDGNTPTDNADIGNIISEPGVAPPMNPIETNATLAKNSNGGDGTPCGFYVGNNPSTYRSPEEYAYDIETEKVDIYSMGNIFYTLLTDMDPWEDEEKRFHEDKIQRMIVDGARPHIPKEIMKSSDVVDVALKEVMSMCWKNDPKERPRARDVSNFLLETLNNLSSVSKKANDDDDEN